MFFLFFFVTSWFDGERSYFWRKHHNVMEAFALYLLLCMLVSLIASNRKIGKWRALLLSLFLTPVIGLIITLLSRRVYQIPSYTDLFRSRGKWNRPYVAKHTGVHKMASLINEENQNVYEFLDAVYDIPIIIDFDTIDIPAKASW